jgi:hypothetical protein
MFVYTKQMKDCGYTVEDRDGYPLHVARDGVNIKMFDPDEIGKATPHGVATTKKLVLRRAMEESRRQKYDCWTSPYSSQATIIKAQRACSRHFDPSMSAVRVVKKHRLLNRFRGMSAIAALFITESDVSAFLQKFIQARCEQRKWTIGKQGKPLIHRGDQSVRLRGKWILAGMLQFCGFRRPNTKGGIHFEFPHGETQSVDPLPWGKESTFSVHPFPSTTDIAEKDMFAAPQVHVIETSPAHVKYNNETKRRLTSKCKDYVPLGSNAQVKRHLKCMIQEGHGFVGIGMKRVQGEDGSESYQKRMKERTASQLERTSSKFDDVLLHVNAIPLGSIPQDVEDAVTTVKMQSRLPLSDSMEDVHGSVHEIHTSIDSFDQYDGRGRLRNATGSFCLAYQAYSKPVRLSNVEERLEVRMTPLPFDLISNTSHALLDFMLHCTRKKIMDEVVNDLVNEMLTTLNV